MSVGGAVVVVGLFVWLVHVLKLVPLAKDAIAISRRSAAIMGDSTLDDDAKETAIQQSAVRLIKLSFLLLVGSAVALAAPMGVIWLLEVVGLVSLDAVVTILLRSDFLVLATVVGIASFVVLERRKR